MNQVLVTLLLLLISSASYSADYDLRFGPQPVARTTYVPVTNPVAAPKGKQTLTVIVGGPRPRYSVGLRAGAGIPFGGFADLHGTGPAAAIDFSYRYHPDAILEFYWAWESQPFRGNVAGGTPVPFRAIGTGIKILNEFWRMDAMSAFAGAGTGLFFVQRTREVLHDPPGPKVTYDAQLENTTALALIGCFGLSYAFTPHWTSRAEVQLMDLNLTGGTSDNLLLVQPSLSIRRIF